MTEKSFKLSVLTPEKTLFDGEVVALFLPGVEGDMEILAFHADILAMLRKGKISYRGRSGKSKALSIASGFFQMKANRAVLLVEISPT